jgi:hypothetical protein
VPKLPENYDVHLWEDPRSWTHVNSTLTTKLVLDHAIYFHPHE